MANDFESQVPHLSESTVAKILSTISTVDLRDLMATVFTGLGDGSIASTDRVRAQAGGHMASAMAAAVPSQNVTGGKVYSTVNGRFTFLIVLFDLDGQLICTMDGGTITEARTPALSALAIDVLGPPSPTRAAVIGTGRECIPHINMLSTIVNEPIRVWGRDRDRVEQRIREARALGLNVIPAGTVVDAVTGCDVVVTVTSADSPVLLSEHVDDSMLICAVGATKPQRCEIEPAAIGRASVVVTDSVSGAPVECGDLIHAVADGVFSWDDLVGLPDVLMAPSTYPRPGAVGPVVFETQGVAVQDIATAALIWDRWSQQP